MHDKINFKILNIIKQKHITQKDLAKKMKIKPSSISRMLSGKYHLKLDTVQKIAKALNISVEDLLDDNKNFSDVNLSIFNTGKNQQTINKNTVPEQISILKEKLQLREEKIKLLEEKIKFLEKKKWKE